MNNQIQYWPVADLCEELSGYRPVAQTVRRWVTGVNRKGKILPAIKAGNTYRCTREAMIDFLQVDVAQRPKSESQKACSESSKAKSHSRDAAFLDASGVLITKNLCDIDTVKFES